MDPELKKSLEEFFEEEDIEEINEELETLKGEDIEKQKKLSDAALKAIKGAVTILSKYKDEFPDDVSKALKALVKYASYGYPEKQVEKSGIEIEDLLDVKKAGAKLSKATITELQKIIETLKSMIGEREDDIKKDGLKDLKELPPEVIAKMERLRLLEEQEKTRIEKEEKEKDQKLLDTIEELKGDIEELKKGKGVKKSIEGQDNDEDDDAGDEDPYPSIPVLKP